MRELRVAESIPAYLTTMVVRRAGRLKARMARAAPLPEDEPADPRPAAPEESMQQRTYLPWLEECVGALTVRSRSVLRLQFGHDLSLADVGSRLGVSKQAAGKVSLKGLQALRQCLAAREKGAGHDRGPESAGAGTAPGPVGPGRKQAP